MQWKVRQVAFLTIGILLAAGSYIYFAEPWGPGPNGLWGRADHNHDGVVTRDEMALFGSQKPHRDGPRLLMHFDAADIDKDQRVSQAEIDRYGTAVGSQDPFEQQRRRDC